MVLSKDKQFKFPQAMVFDKDGTILDFYAYWYPVAYNATLAVLERYSAPKEKADSVMRAAGVCDGVVDIQGVLCSTTYEGFGKLVYDAITESGIISNEKEVVLLTVEELKASLPCGELVPTCKNMVDVLKMLKQMGIKLFVSTNDKKITTKAILTNLGIIDLFEEFVTTDDVPSKPNPDGLNYLIEKYGFSRDRVYMVGDTLTDLRYAKNAGVVAVGIGDSQENLKILSQLADVLSKDISTLVEKIEMLK